MNCRQRRQSIPTAPTSRCWSPPTGSVALVGAPLHDPDGRTYIATLAVTGSGVAIAYRKVWLGSEERQRFDPGEQAAVYDVDGWRLGLAICKDTSVAAHTRDLADRAIDVYVAGLVMHPGEIEEQDERARRIAADTGVYVAFAGFAGPTGSGYNTTAGGSSIWSPDGGLLAHAGSATGEIARAALTDRRPADITGSLEGEDITT